MAGVVYSLGAARRNSPATGGGADGGGDGDHTREAAWTVAVGSFPGNFADMAGDPKKLGLWLGIPIYANSWLNYG